LGLDEKITLLASRPESTSIKMLGTRTPGDTTEWSRNPTTKKIRKRLAPYFFNLNLKFRV
jgi:hypothetical protein